MNRKQIIPLESEEQQALFQWARMAEGQYPELRLMYHIPNGGYRNKATAARLVGEGVKPGVPDICLPVARGKYHSLYIELKRTEKGRLSDDQISWLGALTRCGNLAVMREGWQDAKNTIEEYLRL